MATPWVAFIFSSTQLQALLNETPNRRSSKQLPCSIAKLARQLVRQGWQPAAPYYADYNRGKVVPLQDTHPGAIALAKARKFSHKTGRATAGRSNRAQAAENFHRKCPGPVANEMAWFAASSDFPGLVYSASVGARIMKIAIVGLGYVGLPLSLQFAKSGVDVLGLDIDRTKVDWLNRGKSYIRHIPSAEIKTQLKAGRLAAS